MRSSYLRHLYLLEFTQYVLKKNSNSVVVPCYALLHEFISVCEARKVIGCGLAGGGSIPSRERMFLYMTTNNLKTFILLDAAGILSSRLLWAGRTLRVF